MLYSWGRRFRSLYPWPLPVQQLLNCQNDEAGNCGRQNVNCELSHSFGLRRRLMPSAFFLPILPPGPLALFMIFCSLGRPPLKMLCPPPACWPSRQKAAASRSNRCPPLCCAPPSRAEHAGVCRYDAAQARLPDCLLQPRSSRCGCASSGSQ